MRIRPLLLCALFAAPLFAGCGNDDLPAGMVGAYARDVTYQDGNHRLRLDVTPTGMSVTGGPGTQTIAVGGTPTAGGGVAKIGAGGSALFKTMKCFNDFSCRFGTENGCDGTFTRDSSGSIVLVATGECETWSGKWQPEKDMPAPTAAPSASASESASASATATLPGGQVPAATPSGTATAAPSGTATASPSGTASATGLPTTLPTTLPTSIPTSIPTANVTCLSKCNDANIACVRECKVSDLECMKKCSNTLVSCAQKCQ